LTLVPAGPWLVQTFTPADTAGAPPAKFARATSSAADPMLRVRTAQSTDLIDRILLERA
jgi:hypothetical protein